jgi:hypothetical protein
MIEGAIFRLKLRQPNSQLVGSNADPRRARVSNRTALAISRDRAIAGSQDTVQVGPSESVSIRPVLEDGFSKLVRLTIWCRDLPRGLARSETVRFALLHEAHNVFHPIFILLTPSKSSNLE